MALSPTYSSLCGGIQVVIVKSNHTLARTLTSKQITATCQWYRHATTCPIRQQGVGRKEVAEELDGDDSDEDEDTSSEGDGGTKRQTVSGAPSTSKVRS